MKRPPLSPHSERSASLLYLACNIAVEAAFKGTEEDA